MAKTRGMNIRLKLVLVDIGVNKEGIMAKDKDKAKVYIKMLNFV